LALVEFSADRNRVMASVTENNPIFFVGIKYVGLGR